MLFSVRTLHRRDTVSVHPGGENCHSKVSSFSSREGTDPGSMLHRAQDQHFFGEEKHTHMDKELVAI